MKKKVIFLVLLFVTLLAYKSYAEEADAPLQLSEEELLRQKQCKGIISLIEKDKYAFARPNEELVARKFYYEKVTSLFDKYLNQENKEGHGLYYVDILNNKKPMLLLKVKETEFCNYSYFVYFAENDEIKRLVKNRNRPYNDDFNDNYKLFCKGESEMNIIKVKGENFLISKNKNGRVNRIDRLQMTGNEITLNPVCIF